MPQLARRAPASFLAAALVLVAPMLPACRETPSEPPGGPAGSTDAPAAAPDFLISDAAHGGTPHFFFLPPSFPQPQPTGAFDATLAPTVRICALSGQGVCGATIATYTRQSGPGGERVRLNQQKELYAVDWRSSEFQISDAVDYRVTVGVGANALGIVDVDVVRNAGELANVNPEQFVGLIRGRTLAIRFRIERGLVGTLVVQPKSVRTAVDDTVRFSARARDLHGALVPAANLPIDWSSSDTQVMNIDPPSGTAVGVSAGAATIIAHLGLVSSSPVPVVVGPAKLIAFSYRGPSESGAHIWTVTSSGKTPTQITFGDANDVAPTWSPDGSTITFNRDFGFGIHIYRMNPDGSGLTVLANETGENESSHWSPDGTRIAYTRDIFEPTGNLVDSVGIFVMNPDGTGKVRITRDAGFNGWSPDSKSLVYQAGFGVRRVEIDGTGDTDLSKFSPGSVAKDLWPQWSPGGGRIAYAHSRLADVYGEIGTMNADGTGKTALTSSLGVEDAQPVWSPDGGRIAWTRDFGDLWVMNADGTGAISLTTGPDDDGQVIPLKTGNEDPTWSPDGKALVFSRRTPTDEFDIYRVATSGAGGLVNLTSSLPGMSQSPELAALSRETLYRDYI